ncbi:MAG: DEAD/DEAH box helicase family protein [bacterium]|nr:DEAD/DEAH box helicase family protein [bacterium]
MKIEPRIYQELAIKAALKGLRGRFKRALVVMATGLGKTLTAVFVTKKFRPKKTLFLVHNNHILKHALDEFRLVFDEKTIMVTYNGMSKDGAKEANIVFATWQTMGNHLTEWTQNHFDLIIVDEAHHSEASTYRPVIDYFTGAKLGMTATPDREDKRNIRNIFGDEVVNITLEEAIARGWLPRIEYHVVTDESLDDNALQEIAAEIHEGKKRFTMAEVNRRIFIKKRDVEITRIINGYLEKAIVFCDSITHAERLSKSLELAETFHSRKGEDQKDSWDKNQKVLGALHNGTIRRVCAVNSFNEGINVPSVGLVAFCRVTGVLTVFRQQLGRGLRPGKDKLIVLDFVGNLERIQLVLEMMNRISDIHEEYTPKNEIEHEGYVRQKFEVSGKGFEFTFSDEVVDLMKVLDHCEREFYATWQEASRAVIRMKISGMIEYKTRYKEDSRLPSSPQQLYQDFPIFSKFFGREPLHRFEFYPTLQEAGVAASCLGITSGPEYRERYKEDPKLPSNPNHIYEDFPSWKKFLNVRNWYSSWSEAQKAIKALGITSREEYNKNYRKDPKLPSNIYFYKEFRGWKKSFNEK